MSQTKTYKTGTQAKHYLTNKSNIVVTNLIREPVLYDYFLTGRIQLETRNKNANKRGNVRKVQNNIKNIKHPCSYNLLNIMN